MEYSRKPLPRIGRHTIEYTAPTSFNSNINSMLYIAWQDNNGIITIHTIHKLTD